MQMAQSMPHGAIREVLNGFFSAIEVDRLRVLKKMGKWNATKSSCQDYFHHAHALFFYPSFLNHQNPYGL
jgi:hypothetical protein